MISEEIILANNKKETKAEYDKKYRDTEEGIKKDRKKNWKKKGVIFENNEYFNNVYDRYLKTLICDWCSIELCEGNIGKHKKTLAHDKESGKVLNILCNKCNLSRRNYKK
tara:strand:- start:144 stop:473 length:330 start_codon:yes stop_codon:yes gene_type:complete